MPDTDKKVLSYKDRAPEIGVIEFYCIPTHDRFAKAVIDTKGINSDSLKLDANLYPNRKLQELWRLYGDAGFQTRVARRATYRALSEDPTSALEELMSDYLKEYPDAEKM